jgi:hypothetical protein
MVARIGTEQRNGRPESVDWQSGWTPRAARPDAGFLCHLLAHALDEPWQRAALRAEPGAAARRYATVAGMR